MKESDITDLLQKISSKIWHTHIKENRPLKANLIPVM